MKTTPRVCFTQTYPAQSRDSIESRFRRGAPATIKLWKYMFDCHQGLKRGGASRLPTSLSPRLMLCACASLWSSAGTRRGPPPQLFTQFRNINRRYHTGPVVYEHTQYMTRKVQTFPFAPRLQVEYPSRLREGQ